MSSGDLDLSSFASRAKEIDIGGDMDIVELGDDMGVGLLANPNKSAPPPSQQSKQISFGSDPIGDLPTISIKPKADLDDIIDINIAPGTKDIHVNRAEEPPPFVVNTGASSSGGGGDPMFMGASDFSNSGTDEENRKKREYLTKLQRLERNDIKGQRMTISNSLEEIKAEYEKLTDSRELEGSIRFYRNAMMTFVSGVEWGNEKIGHRLPVKPQLKGWSESVHTNIEDFDSIFEELHDLYKDGTKWHPLLRLAGTLGVSGVMYHMTNTMAERSGIPGMADILNEDPELQRIIAAKMAAKMGSLGSFMSAASGMNHQPQPSYAGGMTGMPMSQGMQMNQGTSEPPRARREMRGPTGVDDILKAFEAERAMASVPVMRTHADVFAPSGPHPSTPISVSSLRDGVGSAKDPLTGFGMQDAEVASVASGSTMNTERRGRGRRPAPPVGATLNLNV